MKIVLCSDHAGYSLKEQIKDWLKNNYDVLDAGAFSLDKNDSYVDYAKQANKMVVENNCYGIYVCGSGVGMSIVANRHKGLRAAVCYSKDIALLSKQHNNINVLCLGANFVSYEDAKQIISAFLQTEFEGGRHQIRIENIDK